MVDAAYKLYTVKEVSDFAGISIRALHYYDNFGLLKPTAVRPSGYRLYSDTDLERLQEILFFKELDILMGEGKDPADSEVQEQTGLAEFKRNAMHIYCNKMTE